MDSRQPLPRIWMMTDERQGEGLFDALERLPDGAGLVFRHHSLPEPERHDLFARIKTEGERKGLLLMLAGDPEQAVEWGAAGAHGRISGQPVTGLLRSMSVHDHAELEEAANVGVDFIFVSPVFATRSHPEAVPLGPARFGTIVRKSPMPAIALGGMNAERGEVLMALGAHGWAAIDAWTGEASA
jgi:thiamine-phosphate pyrophosphorylase